MHLFTEHTKLALNDKTYDEVFAQDNAYFQPRNVPEYMRDINRIFRTLQDDGVFDEMSENNNGERI